MCAIFLMGTIQHHHVKHRVAVNCEGVFPSSMKPPQKNDLRTSTSAKYDDDVPYDTYTRVLVCRGGEER